MNNNTRGRVLIIDKYHNTLAPLLSTLEDSGYDVILAIKLKEAQRVLADKSIVIDCIIINVIEPIEDSFFDSLPTLINSENKLRVPLIVYSSRLSPRTAQIFYDLGVFQIIEKPYSNKNLSGMIINLVELKRSTIKSPVSTLTRYATLMQSTPVEIVIIDNNFNMLEWNAAFENSNKQAQIAGNYFDTCCGEEYHDFTEHPVSRAAESKNTEHGEVKIIVSHHQKHYNIIATPALDSNDEIEFILVQSIDQTSQIIMENKLRRQVQNFNRILKEQDRTTDYLISVQKDLQKKGAELEKLSLTDYLTCVNNRRKFNDDIKNEALRAARYNHPLSLLLLDIDDFKVINDTYGHPFGDSVLKSLITVLQLSIRETDSISRYGGEEFAIILPETDYETALLVSERIRKNVEMRKLNHDTGEVRITVSIGLSTITSENIDPAKIIQLSDECLYEAKRSGKNKVASINIS